MDLSKSGMLIILDKAPFGCKVTTKSKENYGFVGNCGRSIPGANRLLSVSRSG